MINIKAFVKGVGFILFEGFNIKCLTRPLLSIKYLFQKAGHTSGTMSHYFVMNVMSRLI